MISPLIFLLSLVVFINGEVKTYDNHQVYRLTVTDKAHYEWLVDQLYNNLELDFWTEPHSILDHVDIRIAPEYKDTFLASLQERGIPYTVMINNIQELIDQQLYRDNDTAPDAFSLTQYNTLEDIQSYLTQFSNKHSTFCQVINVGGSTQGRNILAVRITTGNTRKQKSIWIQGGIHAREWISPATVLWIMTMSLEDNLNDWKSLYDEAEVYWIPNINPDGYAYSRSNDRMWRKSRNTNSGSTCVGTDLNRNYITGWGRNDGSSGQPCSETYRGASAFSSPEIRSTTTFITNLAQQTSLVGFMDVHSYSQLWLAPWGYQYLATNDAQKQNQLAGECVAALRSWYGTNYVYGPISDVLYLASGGSVDWAYGALGVVYSYTPELRDTGSYGFLLPPAQIRPSGEETNAAIFLWAKTSLA